MIPPRESTLRTTCPDVEVLREYCWGTLSAARVSALDAHLETCARCVQLIDELDQQSDSFVRALSTLPSSADDEPAYQELHARLLAEPEPVSVTADVLQQVISADSPPFSTSTIPRQLGSYELLDLIGRGAMGSVYRARHIHLDRIVALKVLAANPGADPDAVARFLLEMRAVGQLDHPHIVRATDAGVDHGHHYLVMEYVEGIDMSRVLRATGPLAPADACSIVHQAAVGLQFAHEHGMVHRDVKPSNLLFTRNLQVKLLDLGLVSFVKGAPGHQSPVDGETEEIAQDVVPRGTAHYMSPEQWTQYAEVDGRADIYSLGCTLYKLLTGEEPFRHWQGTRMQAHLNGPIPSVCAARPDLPARLDRMVQRMLAKSRDDRFASARELAQSLQPLAADAQLNRLAVKAGLQPLIGPPQVSRKLRRRAILIGAAAVAGMAALRWLPMQRSARLRVGSWRPLTPNESLVLVPHQADDDGSKWWSGDARDVCMKSSGRALLSLGSPVSVPFALRVGLDLRLPPTPVHTGPPSAQSADTSIAPSPVAAGFFFRYRIHFQGEKDRPGHCLHQCNVMEVAENGAGPELVWKQVRWLVPVDKFDLQEKGILTLRTAEPPIDRHPEVEPDTVLASVPITWNRHGPQQLLVRLGEKHGFPMVEWNGVPILESQWEANEEARFIQRQSPAELRVGFLGKIGLSNCGAETRFLQPELMYGKPS